MIVITDLWADLAMIGMIIANILLLVFFLSMVSSVETDKALDEVIAYCAATVIIVQVVSIFVFAFGATTDWFFFRLEVITTIVFTAINAVCWFLTRPKDLRKSKNEEF